MSITIITIAATVAVMIEVTITVVVVFAVIAISLDRYPSKQQNIGLEVCHTSIIAACHESKIHI